MNKEIEISPRQIASAITNLLNEKEKLEQENKELQEKYNIRSKAYNNILLENVDLHNKIDKAIEYIEDEGITFLNFAGQRTWCGKHDADRILKILKDSDVDE